MAQAVDRFLFGLCFGAGFVCAQGLLNLIMMIIGSGHGVH